MSINNMNIQPSINLPEPKFDGLLSFLPIALRSLSARQLHGFSGVVISFFYSTSTRKTVDIGTKDCALATRDTQCDSFWRERQNVEIDPQGVVDSIAYG